MYHLLKSKGVNPSNHRFERWDPCHGYEVNPGNSTSSSSCSFILCQNAYNPIDNSALEKVDMEIKDPYDIDLGQEQINSEFESSCTQSENSAYTRVFFPSGDYILGDLSSFFQHKNASLNEFWTRCEDQVCDTSNSKHGLFMHPTGQTLRMAVFPTSHTKIEVKIEKQIIQLASRTFGCIAVESESVSKKGKDEYEYSSKKSKECSWIVKEFQEDFYIEYDPFDKKLGFYPLHYPISYSSVAIKPFFVVPLHIPVPIGLKRKAVLTPAPKWNSKQLPETSSLAGTRPKCSSPVSIHFQLDKNKVKTFDQFDFYSEEFDYEPVSPTSSDDMNAT